MSVSPELHAEVIYRDGRCFWASVDREHICRDRWGVRHDPDALLLLTVDHVHLHAGGTRGKKAPDDREHLVAMCHVGNVPGPPRRIRELEREYLHRLYPRSGSA